MSFNCPGTAPDSSGWRGDSVDGVAAAFKDIIGQETRDANTRAREMTEGQSAWEQR